MSSQIVSLVNKDVAWTSSANQFNLAPINDNGLLKLMDFIYNISE